MPPPSSRPAPWRSAWEAPSPGRTRPGDARIVEADARMSDPLRGSRLPGDRLDRDRRGGRDRTGRRGRLRVRRVTGRGACRAPSAERITAAGGTAAWHAADLATEAGADGAVSACVERFGRLDVVYDVAGISGRRHRRRPAPRDDPAGLGGDDRRQRHEHRARAPRGGPTAARPGAAARRPARRDPDDVERRSPAHRRRATSRRTPTPPARAPSRRCRAPRPRTTPRTAFASTSSPRRWSPRR